MKLELTEYEKTSLLQELRKEVKEEIYNSAKGNIVTFKDEIREYIREEVKAQLVKMKEVMHNE